MRNKESRKNQNKQRGERWGEWEKAEIIKIREKEKDMRNEKKSDIGRYLEKIREEIKILDIYLIVW